MHLTPTILQTPAAVLAYLPQGAQVIGWTPTDAHPVLWAATEARWESGTSVRGGVPICFPWFGVGRKPHPMKHGTVRLRDWRVVDSYIDGDDAVAAFSISSTPHDQYGQWELNYQVRAGSELEMVLTITNTGSNPLDVEAALHSYLAVGDVRKIALRGLENVTYEDTVPGQEGEKTQVGEVRLSAQTDRIYASGGPIDVVDPLLKRVIHVKQSGGGKTVVWNPWDKGAANIGDMGNGEWTGMVCVEAAAARANAAVIPAGGSHMLTQTLSLSAL